MYISCVLSPSGGVLNVNQKLRKLGMKNEKFYRAMERERVSDFLIRIYLYLYSSKEDDEKYSKNFKPCSWQRK